MNEAVVKQIPFYRSRALNLGLLWVLFIAAGLGTYFLSRNLEGGAHNAASVFLGNGKVFEISLYADRAEPTSVVVRIGDEVIFNVRDDSRHHMAEERTRRDAPRLESGEFGAKESYSLVFQTKGEMSFYDRQNPDIHVSVVIK